MNARSALAAWFGLIVLYTVATKADSVATVLGGFSVALKRIGDPSVPLIPDVAARAKAAAQTPVLKVNASPSTTNSPTPGAISIPAPNVPSN